MRTLQDAVSTLETPGQFAAWLDGFGANSIVGHTKEAWGCPIATYLGRHGAPYNAQVYPLLGMLDMDHGQWEVGYVDTDTRRVGEPCPLPAWAGRFAQAVDNSATSPGAPITAAQARAILAQVALDLTAEANTPTPPSEGVLAHLERGQVAVTAR